MSTQKRTKLKHLLETWPMHTAIHKEWLQDNGISRDLVRRYISSNWLEYVNKKMFIRPKDTVEWSGVLWGLQQIRPFHIGGKTALELQGQSHFVKFKENFVYLYSQRNFKLPIWLKTYGSNIKIINIRTSLFDTNIGLKDHDFGEYNLTISNPARALCEYIYSIEKYHDYDEAYYLMENLSFINVELMQEILEACNSIKVKRLILCLAKLQNVNWYSKINKNKINLGKGERSIVKNGFFDDEFLITYPKNWHKAEDENIF